MELLSYLARTNLYLILFCSTYWLFLSKHTFFQWNRFYLLGSVAASFLLPAIVFYSDAAVPAAGSGVMETAEMHQAPVRVAEETDYMPVVLLGCYAAGALFMLINLLRSFRRLFLLVRTGEHIQLEDYTLVFTEHSGNGYSGSFSFFRWMFVSRLDYETNPDTIIRHEHVHIRQLHSMDILLIELLKVVFWMNPAVWFYKRAMQSVHEYLADQEAANRESYAAFLVAYALKMPVQMLVNHFSNSSLLKDRIKMIYKNRTPKWLLSKYLLILPLAVITVLYTAARKHIPLPVTYPAHAQPKDILVQGTVSDPGGKGISGAIVIVKNTNQGVATDVNGKFELTNIAENAVLVASQIQYKTSEMALSKAKTRYDFIMERDETVSKNITIPVERTASKPIPVKTADSNSNALKTEEQKPEFPGGYAALLEYLQNSIKYPAAALKANVEGIVIVRFVVDQAGMLNSITIVKGVGFGLDAESIRLVKNMPKWKPGIQNGKPLEMAQTIEIRFDLATAKGDMRQGFHLPSPTPALNFRIARVKIEEIFSSSLAFFEPETFNPYQIPPKAEYRYTPDSSHYRFMNYNHGWPNYNASTTGPARLFKNK
ncbi:TonB family protein [Dyadobacter sediminis]|uniref:TonB family protein n=1 Tax=Dyadobacter sediminis TaxID=1493691 RepID=A0A5R9KIY1_9BACT|nr:TonB family protein [Dyadobacter sediminis]TLU96079.1 TonB family protein [Dyadobacter sediminis]GGB79078.1 cell envelope biogenesis protein TonB [Dyadobacter sediminis]